MRDVARRIYQYGTWLMLVVIIGQFTAAGAGVFSTMADNASGAYILRYHTIAGPLAVLILSLVMIIAAFIGRLPWRMTGLAAAFIPLLPSSGRSGRDEICGSSVSGAPARTSWKPNRRRLPCTCNRLRCKSGTSDFRTGCLTVLPRASVDKGRYVATNCTAVI